MTTALDHGVVPLSATGELATVKPPVVVIVAVPLLAPEGELEVNTTLIVHDALFAKVVAVVVGQVPPAAAAGRENGPVIAIVRVLAVPVELRTVSV